MKETKKVQKKQSAKGTFKLRGVKKGEEEDPIKDLWDAVLQLAKMQAEADKGFRTLCKTVRSNNKEFISVLNVVKKRFTAMGECLYFANLMIMGHLGAGPIDKVIKDTAESVNMTISDDQKQFSNALMVNAMHGTLPGMKRGCHIIN